MSGWSAVQVEDVPAIGPGADPEGWQGFVDDPARYVRGWHGVREHLGIRSFGCNAVTSARGETLVVPHDETEYGGQEELYVVTRGRARFTCGEESFELGPGGLVHCDSRVTRMAVALQTPTTVLMISGSPDLGYKANF
jgi:mannose-6-phosphate isomerase-like protein (cupin superfamily)